MIQNFTRLISCLVVFLCLPIFTNGAFASNAKGSGTDLTVPYVIQNNSRYADNEVYVGLVGKFPGMGDVWMNMTNSQLQLMTYANNTVPGPAWSNTPDQKNKFANMFFKLSDLQNKTINIPHGLFGCRIFISFKSPMYIYFHQTGGYAGANLQNASDPNDGIRWELVELTWGAAGLWTNTSRVDSYQYPMALEVTGFSGGVGGVYRDSYNAAVASGTPNVNLKIGELLKHQTILNNWTSSMPAAYANCKVVKTHSMDNEAVIEQPSKIESFKPGATYGNYFNAYIDEIWSAYSSKDLYLNIGNEGTWKGRVTGNTFNFTNSTGTRTATIYTKPTTINAIEGAGALATTQAAGGTKRYDDDLMIQAQVCAAINRHAIITSTPDGVVQVNADDTRYFKTAPFNNYVSFFHDPTVSYNSMTYAFCYDDVGEHSSTIQCTFPTKVKIIIGGYGENSTTVPVTGVSLSPSNASVVVGATTNVSASVVPSNATNPAVNYASNNPSVASVSATGQVTGLAVGTAIITATSVDGAKTASSTITVSNGTIIFGKIEAENYSTMQGIQTEVTTDTNGGLNVGYVDAGDFMNYNLNVPTSGSYKVEFRVASNVATGVIYLKNGSTVLDTLTVPNTGGWQVWQTVSMNVQLSAGAQTLQVYAKSGNYNINWFNFIANTSIAVSGVSISPTSVSLGLGGTSQLSAVVTPANASNKAINYGSNNSAVASVSASGLVTAVGVGNANITVTTVDGAKTAVCVVSVSSTSLQIPGTIQAESYSNMLGIQTEPTTDTGAGLNVGWIDNGDYMDYNVTVATAGTYNLTFRIASTVATGVVQLKNGSNLLASLPVSNTGGWQIWQTIGVNVPLNAGSQTLKVLASVGGFNINWMAFNTINVASVSLSPANANVAVGNSVQLNSSIAPNPVTNSTVTYTSSNPSIASVSANGLVTGIATGSVVVTVTTVDGAKTASSNITVTGSGASLTGSLAVNSNAVNLTTVGTADWKHFYTNDHKASGSMVNSISNFTAIGGTPGQYSDDLRGMSWSDGSPTVSSNTNRNGNYMIGVGKGYSFTCLAGNGNNTLTIYVGGYYSSGTLRVHLSNSAVADYVNTTVNTAGQWNAVYTINFNAAQAGQNIIVTWTMASGTENVTLQAASLVGNAKSTQIALTESAKQDVIDFQVYPNPSTGLLNINMTNLPENDKTTVTLSDVTGKLVYKNVISQVLNLQINTNYFAHGLYFLNIISGEQKFTKKIIFQ